MLRRRTLTLLAGAAALLGGCAGPVPADYVAERPLLDLARYFDGPLQAHGLFTDRNGKVRRRFVVQLTGTWQGDRGELDERFTYSDGETQRRVWHLERLPGGRYRGTADDVVGSAEGEAAGNALHWNYTLRLPVEGKTYEVQFDDWMYLMDEHVMLNRAAMSKFGLRLGEVTLAFFKP